MIESNEEGKSKIQAYFFASSETHVDRLLDQLNRDETYEPQGITMLDFDDEDEGEEQNEEFTLHSTNTMEYSTFGSYKDEEDEDNDNNSFEDLISPVKEHEEQYPNEVEAEVTHIHLNPPQLPRVVINQVGEDDLVFENKKEQEKVSLVKDEHHVVERCHENSLSKLTHIIVKQIHRKARVGVRKQKLSLCHGKRKFQEVLNSGRLFNFCNKKPRKNNVRKCNQAEEKGIEEYGFSKHKPLLWLRQDNII
ncbi:hypothetical protein Tco_1491101 [Tanacetum coccineum]